MKKLIVFLALFFRVTAGFSQYPILQPESFAFETITEADPYYPKTEGGWRAATVTNLKIEIWKGGFVPKFLGRITLSIHVGTPIQLYKVKRGKDVGIWITTNEAQNACANAADEAAFNLTSWEYFQDWVINKGEGTNRKMAIDAFVKEMQEILGRRYIAGSRVSLRPPPGIWVTPKKAVYR